MRIWKLTAAVLAAALCLGSVAAYADEDDCDHEDEGQAPVVSYGAPYGMVGAPYYYRDVQPYAYVGEGWRARWERRREHALERARRAWHRHAWAVRAPRYDRW
jgi:hypothetical protein